MCPEIQIKSVNCTFCQCDYLDFSIANLSELMCSFLHTVAMAQHMCSAYRNMFYEMRIVLDTEHLNPALNLCKGKMNLFWFRKVNDTLDSFSLTHLACSLDRCWVFVFCCNGLTRLMLQRLTSTRTFDSIILRPARGSDCFIRGIT